MLELYHFPLSRCSRKVRMVLAEKEIPYKSHVINLWTYEQMQPEYLRINPKGLVPVLVHDGKVIVESDNIGIYIDEHFPGKKRLIPADPEAAERMHYFIDLQNKYPRGELTQGNLKNRGLMGRFLRRFYWGKIAFVEEKLKTNPAEFKEWYEHKLEELKKFEATVADPVAQAELLKKVEGTLDEVEAQLATSTWLCDEMFTLADISWLSVLDRLAEVRLESLWTGGRRPNIEKYLARLRARPSFRKSYTQWMPATGLCMVQAALADVKRGILPAQFRTV